METKQKEVLRAQWRHVYQRWVIVSKTYNGSGGWKNFWDTHLYMTKEEADVIIDHLINTKPDKYERG